MNPIALISAFCLFAAAPLLAQQADSDNDGLPTGWEQANGLDPNRSSDAAEDPDIDGVSNLLEYLWGGDPRRADPEIKPLGRVEGPYFAIVLNRRVGQSEFDVRPERAASIPAPAWRASGFVETSRAALNAEIERVTYRLSTPLAGSAAQFVRVAARRLTNEILFRTTFDNLAAIQSPAAGLGGTATLTPNDFLAGRTNSAASFANGRHAVFPVGTVESGRNIDLEKGEIEFWFRPSFSSAGDDQNHVLLVVGDIYSAPRLEITESDRISFNLFDRNFILRSAQSEYHAALFQPGQWAHVRAVWNRASATDALALYIDGQRIGAGATGSWDLGENLALSGIFVGAGNAAGEFGADGLIDELIIRGPAAAPGNQRPSIEALAARTVAQGQSLAFTVTAADPDGGALAFTLSGSVPPGAVIHPQTGAFSWTPDSSVPPGTYSITVRVEDDGSPPQFATAIVDVTVEASTAPDPCPSGPALMGAIEGDLGPMPEIAYTPITCFEIRNDQPSERAEVASAGIPIPRELDLRSVQGLAVVGPGERRVAAQFNIISRWGGPADQDLPIRWLQVVTAARVNPGAKSIYSLRRYNALPDAPDPFAATLLPTGLIRFTTGVSEVILDPSNPALISDITDISQAGVRQPLYRFRPGAGPKLVFASQGTDVTLSTADPNQVQADPGSFDILEVGPVRVVAKIDGHFSDPQGRSRCTVRGETYERFGYTLIATFERGRRDVLLEYHFRNECSDALFPPWTDETAIVKQVSFEVPLETSADSALFFAGAAAVRQTNSASLRIEQAKGGGTPWTRRAQISAGNSSVETAASFRNPILAAASSNHIVAAQIPWMRYREPQAIEVRGGMLSLQFVSQELVVGEGKGIWNFARIAFIPRANLSAAALLQEIESAREHGRLQLERGLLVRAPLDFVNAAGIYPSLGTSARSPIKSAYSTAINLLHDQTVRDGGQWDRAKSFGSQLWPDVQRDAFAVDNATPADNNAAMNYWNPSGAELLEFLRTGDPKWVWDFALPQSWLQMFTAYLNIGDRSHGNRNGLSVTSGGTGEGQWHRSAFGSDDYTYNVGMSLAYALRPNPAFRDRFAQAGRTVIDRYNIPKANEAQREEFVNQIAITRQAIQHFEMLANAAEFVPGSFGVSAHAKFAEIVSELARDNLRAGVMAEGDLPAAGSLTQPQQFMQTSMMYPFFYRYHRNYGDIDGIIRRALTQAPLILYRDGIEKQPDGRSILVQGGWASRPENSLSASGTEVTAFRKGLDSDGLRDMYNFNKPQTLALLLIAHSLDPAVNLCSVSRQAFDDPTMAEFLNSVIVNDAGWWKGADQAFQSLIFGVGLYDVCQ